MSKVTLCFQVIMNLALTSFVTAGALAHAKDDCEARLSYKGRAAIAYKLGARYLVHRTPIRLIPAILDSGKLLPGTEVDRDTVDFDAVGPENGNPFATGEYANVFMSIWPDHREAYGGRWGREDGLADRYTFGGSKPSFAILIFSLNPLNRDNYLLTPINNHGRPMHDSETPERIDAFVKALDKGWHGWQMGNEVVFPSSVSLKDLREIWVDPKAERSAKQVLKSYLPELERRGIVIRGKAYLADD